MNFIRLSLTLLLAALMQVASADDTGISYTDVKLQIARIQDMRLNGKLLDANKTYKVAGWAPVSEATRDKGGEAIWDLVARHLRNEKVIKTVQPNVPKLKGVAGNPGMV